MNLRFFHFFQFIISVIYIKAKQKNNLNDTKAIENKIYYKESLLEGNDKNIYYKSNDINITKLNILNIIKKDNIKSNNKRILSQDENSTTECIAGKFLALHVINNTCLECPAGYECSENGTFWPKICKEGYYKTSSENCIPCPEGTFSFMKGIKDSSLCILCPPGTICDKKGINNLNGIKNCQEGYVCGEATGFFQKEKCPKGFYCKEGTYPLIEYELKCPEGYICSEGFGDENKYDIICPIDYYCPLGTGFFAQDNVEEMEVEFNSIPKCPYGTSSFEKEGLKSLIECKITEGYFILSNYEIYHNTQNNSEINENKNNLDSNNDNESENDEKQLTEDIYIYYNYLKNLNIIDIFLSKYDSNLIFDFKLNKLRKPLISFSPINLTSSAIPFKSEQINITEFTEFFQIYKHYFKIEKNSYALITIDLRHIISLSNEFFFIYGIDWDITFEKVLSIENYIYEELYVPTTFISKDNDKSNVHEFNIYSFEDMILSFNINIYNGLYSTYLSYFKDIATIVNLYPERAELSTNKFFGVFLLRDNIDTITLPVNIPIKNISFNSASNPNLQLKDKILKNIISYNSLTNNKMIRNEIREGLNKYQQTNNYWDLSTSLGITHIPFISNCKGYGKYIHLWSLLEQNSQCHIKSENETMFVEDFSFLTQAVGDNCNISLECIFDEDMKNISNNKYWFQTSTGFTLFKISKNPISLEMLDKSEDLELVNVIVQNSLENDEIPKNITLRINYFQVSKTLKRIIDAQIIFSNPWNKSQLQNLNDSVPYTFNVFFNPYSHTNLMITFALSSRFYIVLYLVVGFASTIIVFIFFFLHRQFCHVKPRPTFKIATYFPLILPPAIIGTILSIIPIFLEIAICHFFFVGKFLFTKVKLLRIKNYKGEECDSIFDLIGYIGEAELSSIRKGRLGTAFFILGVFLTYYHTQLVVPNAPVKTKRSFDNNRFDFIIWKRIYVYYVDFLLSIVNIYYTILSFCKLWSDNIWYFIYSYKIIGIIAENYFEFMFQEQLLIAGFGCLFNIMQNMITFGASNLIDFLLSALIEQLSLIIEKVYLEKGTNYLKDHWDEYTKTIKDFIRKLKKFDIDLEFENKENENIDEEFDDEAIILDEEEEKESDNMEKYESSSLGKEKSLKSDKLEGSKEYSNSHLNKKNEEKKGIEIEEYLDRYKGFASDLLSYIYNIFFYFLLWITREENYILDYYDISDKNFKYFYYFSMVNIVFSIINDIILHNLIEQTFNIQMNDFLDYFNYRYHIRTENWALDQQDINYQLDPASIKMFKLGFSSQYYFLKTIYVSGLLFIVIGIVTLILNEINPFLDLATPLIFVFVYITLKIILVFSSIFIHIFKIWEIDKNQKDAHDNKILKILKDIDNEKKKKYKLDNKKWEKYIKDQEQIIEENLKTERLILDNTKKQFIAQNKQWFRDEIENIITPRTLLQNKKQLIKVLGKKYSKNVKTNYNILSVKLYSPNNSLNNFTESNIDNNDINSENLSYIDRKNNFKFKTKNNNIVLEILRIWRNRTNLNKRLMKMMKLTIIEMKKKKCCECGSKNNLNVVYVGDMINSFVNFLKEHKKTMDNFKDIDFKIYFKNTEKNKIKTLCINCSYK